MSQNPEKVRLFSIVIPFKNAERDLLITLQSVKNQSYQHWECILVNDESTNEFIHQLESWVHEDQRFTLINGKSGANVCRNIGLNQAKGDFVIFLDADDFLSTTCLFDRLTFFEDNLTCDFIISQTIMLDQSGKEQKGTFKTSTTDIDQLLLLFLQHQIQWTTTAPTWKLSYLKNIGGFNEVYPRLQDIELNIRALLTSPKIEFLDKYDSYYTQSLFTTEKRYAAQHAFLYIIKDYYHSFKLKFNEHKNLLSTVEKAFSDSLKNSIVLDKQRRHWYNPLFRMETNNILSATRIILEKDIDHELGYSTYIQELPKTNKFTLESFITSWTNYIQQKENKNPYLNFGFAGDLLYLFIALYLDLENINIDNIQTLTERIYHQINNSTKHFESTTYWDDSTGLIYLLELLLEHDLIDTNVTELFLDLDHQLSVILIQQTNFDNDTILAANVLWKRTEKYNKTNTIKRKTAIIIVSIIEQILRKIQNEPINIFTEDLSIEIGFLTKAYSQGYFQEPIKQTLRFFLENQTLRYNKYPHTVESMNNLFSTIDFIEKSDIDIDILAHYRENLRMVNYSQINLGNDKFFRITVSYLRFLNNLIAYNRDQHSEIIDTFLQERLHHDIHFSFPMENPKIVQGGIIGTSGIALTLLSYINNETPKWTSIFNI